jgi:soluble P-type ATPase
MNRNDTIFTEMENRVIGELKETIDPVIMSEEEQHVEFVRIGNVIGIESFEVRDICERWMKEELLLSMEQTNAHIIR